MTDCCRGSDKKTIGLSLPEAIILRRVLTARLILAFFCVVAFGILIVGYLFNAIM